MPKIRTATLELTRNCNFSCTHCYIETTLKGGDVLSAKEWVKVIKRLVDIGCRHYILTGGEALISEAFPEVYQYLKENNCRVDIFTNGSILKQLHKDLFTQFPPDSVSITLYGKTSEQYKSLTGCGGAILNVVKNNIETLQSMGIQVHIGSLLCKGLESESINMEGAGISPVEMNTYLMPALHSRKNLSQRLSPKDILELEKGDPSRDEVNRQVYKNLKPLNIESDEYLRKCSGGHSSLFVSAFGMVSICAIYRKVSFDMLDETKTIKEVLQELKSVHENFKKIYFESKCGTCDLNRNCRSCPAYSLLETGRLGETPYLCELSQIRKEYYSN